MFNEFMKYTYCALDIILRGSDTVDLNKKKNYLSMLSMRSYISQRDFFKCNPSLLHITCSQLQVQLFCILEPHVLISFERSSQGASSGQLKNIVYTKTVILDALGLFELCKTL